MASRLGITVRAGLFTLLLTAGLSAPALLNAAPAGAQVSQGNCYSGSGQVAGGTRVPCSGDTSDQDASGNCTAVQNGFKTCDVRKLGNGLEYFALILAVAGIFLSASLWALGSHGSNPGQELTGKRGIVICLVAALMIGAYPALTTFYDNIANNSNVDKTGVTKAAPPTIVVQTNTPDSNTNGSKN